MSASFTLGGMEFSAHVATDPSSGESITYVHRLDLHPKALVAQLHKDGSYINPEHRYFNEDVLAEAVAEYRR